MPEHADEASGELLVSVRGLGKSYPKVFQRRDRLRALGALMRGRSSVESVSVLRDVDLDVRRGQSLGLIGENGAGKSTLLKLIAGVLTPTLGSVTVSGRVGALLELGAGFHPEYSGRDNIVMSATLYGLTRAELRTKLDEIVAFADIGNYIDEPVKHYSSGMIVRLGFAVVAAVRPDLLITDEVLAVGDEAFQKKCVRWIEDYLEQGGTLLLVSHSMYHIQKLCRQACWIKDGTIAARGDVFDVTQAYLAYQERRSSAQLGPRKAEAGTQEFVLTGLAVNGIDADTLVVDAAQSLRAGIRVRSRDGRVPVVAVGIGRADGTSIYGVTTEMDGVQPRIGEHGDYCIDIEFPDLPLLPGSYTLRVHVMDSEGVRLFDTLERTLSIRGNSREFGLVRLSHAWRNVEPVAKSSLRVIGS